jgi:alpha-L-fucosidase
VDTTTLPTGVRVGNHWIPAEADVSIRPGWFYHAGQDSQVRSAENLVELYFKSVGRGASLLLNLPPDRRGQIHSNDESSLVGFRQILDETFDENLLNQAALTTSDQRGEGFEAANLLDADKATYWSTYDETTDAEVIATFVTPVRFNVIDLREHLPLGQRVEQWSVSYWTGNEWKQFATGESIGSRCLWRGPTVETNKIKLQVAGPVCPAISEFGVYRGPFELEE